MTATRPRIAVVGSLNMDLVIRTPALPRPGETVLGRDVQFVPGGKGANQAVAAARLGGDVTLVGRVGEDDHGRQLLASQRDAGVSTGCVGVTRGVPTGLAIVQVDDEGENAITVIPGANAEVAPADIGTATALVSAARVLLVQLEVPLPAVLAALGTARYHGVTTILDPAPAPRGTTPDELLDVDWLCPNESEATALSGIAITDDASAEQAVRALLQRGARHVALTRGARGVLLGRRDPSNAVRLDTYPSPTVRAVDTTAAGDAFAGGLAVALGEGLPLEQAMGLACAAGALAASKPGAQPAMPIRAEAEALLREEDRT